MKPILGLILAFALGFACRAFGIPSPAPPLILGALLVMTMTIGYILVDRYVSAHPAAHKEDCGGPSGLTVRHTAVLDSEEEAELESFPASDPPAIPPPRS